MQAYNKKGFWIGLAAFFFILLSPNPESLPSVGWAVAAVTLLMAIWWATEAVPVAVTALLPLACFPMLGVTDFKTAALPYANPNIYLFMGGFILALGIESSGLHKRLALKMLIAVGNSGAKLIAGFMLVSAIISMWVMNTSTTLMLLPIGLAVCASVAETIPNFSQTDRRNFEISLLLGIAYAASIGGMSTLVGTAPNIIFVGFMQETYGLEISFTDWMKLGVPIATFMLFSSWYAITKIVYPVNFIASVETKLQLQNMLNDLGPLSKDEKKVLIIFSLAASAWMFRTLLDNYVPFSGLTDAGIAIIAALSFFLIPSENKQTDLLTWEQANKLPWGLLVLFGGGLSLAASIGSSGLGGWIGQGLTVLENVPSIILILAVATMIIFLTEITSNVATTSTFLPVVGAVAVALGIAPISLTIPVVLAASCAFMLPVATPPNAIVFGSGKLTIPDMIRAGFALNIIGIFLVTLFAFYLAPMIF
ncbi:MAG: DASS family sodium-coupled anion symporter [SAR86 cluster bacterium]|uniref:DASS family sodium-coupled anion symporter n=1 Tax=SAR86 cluster bacterium TaxID=2030880 RepID=A0A838Y7G1_9GAMM|nr:DASS family sodium-coupled anion symporter [SAR86 cluster bacterium]